MTEGETKECGKCNTEIIHVKIITEWNGKKEEKLQWQNVEDKKPHFKYVSPNKYNCKMPLTREEQIVAQTTMDEATPNTRGEIKGKTFPEETRGEIKGETLPKFTNAQWTENETIILLLIEEYVKSTLQKFMPKTQEPNTQKIGMFVKLIYEELKRKSRDVS